jgi:hypothetical protein
VTRAACEACPRLANVVFCGARLRDVYRWLEQTPAEAPAASAPCALLGVCTGGDRSYRQSPALRGRIQEIATYESGPAPGALALLRAAVGWLGAGGEVVVTSSKAAALLLDAVAPAGTGAAGLDGLSGAHTDLDAAGAAGGVAALLQRSRIVALGASTAAAVAAAAARHGLVCSGLVAAASPTIGAIAEVIQRAGGHHAASPAVVAGERPDFERHAPCPIDADGDDDDGSTVG